MVDRDKLLEDLRDYVRNNEVFLTVLAKDIGISYRTLSSALEGAHTFNLRTWLKIEQFLQEK